MREGWTTGIASGGFQFSPGLFKSKDADPEVTLERFEKYIENLTNAFRLNRRINPQTGGKVNFDNEEKVAILKLEGGACMQDLLKHTGKVEDIDTYNQALNKVRAGLKRQGNRTAQVFNYSQVCPRAHRASRPGTGRCMRRQS